jgi:hypothetical protein
VKKGASLESVKAGFQFPVGRIGLQFLGGSRVPSAPTTRSLSPFPCIPTADVGEARCEVGFFFAAGHGGAMCGGRSAMSICSQPFASICILCVVLRPFASICVDLHLPGFPSTAVGIGHGGLAACDSAAARSRCSSVSVLPPVLCSYANSFLYHLFLVLILLPPAVSRGEGLAEVLRRRPWRGDRAVRSFSFLLRTSTT